MRLAEFRIQSFRRLARLSIASAIAILLLAGPAFAQVRLHVDPTLPASGNGLTWATAFRGIKAAVNAAIANPAVTEIWVKRGTYFPGTSPYVSRDGLAIYGGFAGTETSLAERDLASNESILTGQSSARIITGSGLGPSAVFDGFTIRDASTSTSGGAVFGGSMTFRKCRFIANRAGSRGGVYSSYAEGPTFVDCRFIGNEAPGGGGVLDVYEGSVTFVNCRIVQNDSGTGSAVSTYDGPMTFINCLVAGNLSSQGGGVSTYEGAVVAIQCTFASNEGFGLSSYGGPAKIVRNCMFFDNGLGGPSDVAYSRLDVEAPGEGNVTEVPVFANPKARDWRLGAGSAGIDAGSSALLPADAFDLDGDGDVAEPHPIDANGFARVRDELGKGPNVDMGAFEHFPDCNLNLVEDAADVAAGTSADLDGNGVPDECEDCNGNDLPDALDIASGASEDCQKDGTPDECQQEIVVRTYKVDDGSAENSIGTTGVNDVAWLNRFEVVEGGEVLRELRIAFGPGLPAGSPVDVCVWRDPDQDGSPADARIVRREQIVVETTGASQLQAIDVADVYVGPSGTRFFVGVFAQGSSALAPLDQTAGSAGRSWIAVADLGTLDLDELASAELLGLVDGFGFPGDWLVRAVAWVEIDCDANGQLDACDVLDGAPDCQGDGIPDVCQLEGNDCDSDGIPDDCEFADGTLSDCEPDGVPDACEIASGGASDLDGNGVPDECEDCNLNAIPDSLDIAAGAPDCQPDGIPDECQLSSDGSEQYRRDDGNAEYFVSSDAPNMAWLVRYLVEEGAERVVSVEIMHALLPVGKPVDVYVWSDPNGDGDPADARVISHLATSVKSPNSATFESADVPDVYVGPAGTSFFVGAIVHDFVLFTDYPGAKDNKPASYTSWLVGKLGTIDPNDLSADADEFLRIDDLGGPFVGTWCVRATADLTNDCNENGVPDDCDIDAGTSGDANRDGRPDECDAAPCLPDLDGDGEVGALDLATVLGSWGLTRSKSDLDGDGVVGAGDLAALLAAWGPCP